MFLTGFDTLREERRGKWSEESWSVTDTDATSWSDACDKPLCALTSRMWPNLCVGSVTNWVREWLVRERQTKALSASVRRVLVIKGKVDTNRQGEEVCPVVDCRVQGEGGFHRETLMRKACFGGWTVDAREDESLTRGVENDFNFKGFKRCSWGKESVEKKKERILIRLCKGRQYRHRKYLPSRERVRPAQKFQVWFHRVQWFGI